jgi:hypothetical protein
MEGSSKETDPMFMKKDIFIKTRKEDIRLYYEFNPKVVCGLVRSLGEEPMAWSTRRD